MNVLSSKWVYKHKMDDEGKIIRHNARLVAIGSNQEDGIDFTKMFAPVVKPATIRLILSIAVTKSWKLRQLDGSNAFLHGVLEDDIYMHQPSGFKDDRHQDYVCKFLKVIYGLRQSPHVWFRRLRDFLLSINFRETLSDQSLFIFSEKGVTTYFLVYVNDIIFTSSLDEFVSMVIAKLGEEFALKDLGPLSFFLGIRVGLKLDLSVQRTNWLIS